MGDYQTKFFKDITAIKADADERETYMTGQVDKIAKRVDDAKANFVNKIRNVEK